MWSGAVWPLTPPCSDSAWPKRIFSALVTCVVDVLLVFAGRDVGSSEDWPVEWYVSGVYESAKVGISSVLCSKGSAWMENRVTWSLGNLNDVPPSCPGSLAVGFVTVLIDSYL